MLAHGERKQHVADLRVARLLLGDNLEIGGAHLAGVPVLNQKAARERFEGKPRRARRGQGAGQQEAQIFLFGEQRDCLFIRVRRDHDFREDVGDELCGRLVQPAVDGDHAAKRRHRIARQRARISLRQRVPKRDAAWIGVLDDGDGGERGGIEFGDELISRVGVVQIVVREFLALRLARAGDAGPLLGCDIKRSALMGIFSVAQRLAQAPAQRTPSRRRFTKLRREPG